MSGARTAFATRVARTSLATRTAARCATARARSVLVAEDSAEHAADRPRAEHRAFVLRAAALRCCREDARSESRERQALQPHRSGPRDLGEEESLAAEEGRLDLADVLDLEGHARRQRDDASGIDEERLPGLQLAANDRAAGVHEREPVAVEPLHDEALAAEEADREPLLEPDPERDAARGAEERVLLADQRAAELAQVHREDLAGVRRGECDAALAAALVGVDGREERLAGDEPLAGAEELAEQSAATLPRRVAEHGVHLDAGVHEHHAAGLADRRLAGVELDLDELHLGTVDLVVHDVHRHR